MRFRHLAFLTCFLSCAAPAGFAQQEGAPDDLTPREKILVSIGVDIPGVQDEQTVSDETPQTIEVLDDSREPLEAAKKTVIGAEAPEIIQTDAFSRQAAAAAKIFSTEDNAGDSEDPANSQTDAEFLIKEKSGDEETREITLESDPPAEPASSAATAALAPFYLSASAYEDLRGGKAQAQIILSYLYHTEDLAGKKQGKAVSVDLILGEDFAEINRNGVRKIYDFKLNRLLTFKPDLDPSNPPIFDNISLFSKAYRNLMTVNKTTNRGKNRVIEVGERTLDAFWIESAMSWAAKPLTTPVQAVTEDDVLYIKHNDEIVLAAKPGKEDFAGAFDRDSFFALAHHEWPLHPEALQRLADFKGPAAKIEILVNNPRNPEGVWHIWNLQSRKELHEPLKLNADALSAVQRNPVAPIAFIINEAVNDRALGGLMPADKISGQFAAEMKTKDYDAAWLTAQRYDQYTAACKDRMVSGSKDPVCAGLTKIETNLTNKLSEQTNTYIYGLARLKKSPVDGIKLLQPVLDDEATPGFLISAVAMTRARMKKREAATHGVSKLIAETLLKQALAKDPYNPNIYLGLAQVFAAQGSFEQSWDVYDALRAGIPTVGAVDMKIDRVEANLLKSAPGYFLVTD